MEKIKVLYFVDRLRHGGIQQMIVEILKKIDKEKVQIDLLVFDDGETYSLENVIRNLGINLYKIDAWIWKPWDYINQAKVLDEFFKGHHDYKVVHLHSTSKNYIVLKKAKKYGIPVRIAHSHAIGFQTKNKIKIAVGNLFKKLLNKYATHFFACSEEAGKWLFGNKNVKSNNFMIIHNGVDLEKYEFKQEIRNNLRKELLINEDTVVIGHVGRFVELKNHDFLVDIFYEYNKEIPNSKLLLIGTGEKEDEIKNKVEKLGIERDVIFAGFKNNVNDYLNVMDLFVLPSKTEGLGLVLIEAQANGLKCFASKDVIPEESKVSELLEFIPLEKSAKEWANFILDNNIERKDIRKELEEKLYLIEQTAKELEKFYLGE